MSIRNLPFSLKKILLLDAATCAAMGLVLTMGIGLLPGLLNLPRDLLFYAGAILFPVALFMVLVATRPVIPWAGMAVIVAGNILWVAGSLFLLFSNLAAPNGLGIAFIAVQATAVAILAWAEIIAPRGGGEHMAAYGKPSGS